MQMSATVKPSAILCRICAAVVFELSRKLQAGFTVSFRKFTTSETCPPSVFFAAPRPVKLFGFFYTVFLEP